MSANRKTEPLLAAYAAIGEDTLKREAVMKRLYARVAEHGDLSFNSDQFNGEATSGEAIVAACNTLPFASDLRLVIVKEVERLSRNDAQALAAYLKAPSSTTVLALEGEKLAKNSALYKAVASVGPKAIIDCTPPKRYELPRQVKAMASRHGIQFTNGAAEKLVELVGEDTVHLDSEIRKIALAHRGSDPVNESEVITLTARTAEVKPWEFVDAFAARDLKKCLHYYTMMESVSPHALLPMCVNRIRELICAKSLAHRGELSNLATTLNVPAWRVKNHARWAKEFSARELRQALSNARDTERAMKSGADANQTLLDWVVATLHK